VEERPRGGRPAHGLTQTTAVGQAASRRPGDALDLFRVLAHWPKDRYLELAPKYWAQTRARLDPTHLGHEFGPLTVPLALVAATEEKAPTNSAG
jgi:hypothetical protein